MRMVFEPISIAMLDLDLLFLGWVDEHALQVQPITGTPVDVPQPSIRTFIVKPSAVF